MNAVPLAQEHSFTHASILVYGYPAEVGALFTTVSSFRVSRVGRVSRVSRALVNEDTQRYFV